MNNGFLRSVLVYPCPPPLYENYADWNTIPYAEENFTAAYRLCRSLGNCCHRPLRHHNLSPQLTRRRRCLPRLERSR